MVKDSGLSLPWPGFNPWLGKIPQAVWHGQKRRVTLFSAICSCLKMKYSLGAPWKKGSDKNVKR